MPQSPIAEEHTGDRAGQRGRAGRRPARGRPAAFVGEQRDEAEREPEREREPTDGEIDRGADREPARGDGAGGSEVPLEQRGERGRCDDAAGDADRQRAEPRGERRIHDAVSERVVAAVPLPVPQRQADVAEQLDPEQVGRPIGAARARHRDHGAEHAGRPAEQRPRPAPGGQPTAAGACSRSESGVAFTSDPDSSHHDAHSSGTA